MDTQLHVILDDQKFVSRKKGTKPKTLILLHGLSDNSAIWMRDTSIDRYAERYNLTVVMPETQRGFYSNMMYGPNYEDYIVKELPELCESLFNTSVAPGDLMIAGLSMGGYGALRLSLKYPEIFRIAGVFSAGISMADVANHVPETNPISGDAAQEVVNIYGRKTGLPEDSDCIKLAQRLAESGKKAPRYYHCCGTEDFTYPWNLRFKETAEALGFDYHFEEWAGVHEWGFWDVAIDRFFHYFLDETL